MVGKKRGKPTKLVSNATRPKIVSGETITVLLEQMLRVTE
jgi:hypothetical protein